MRVDEHTTTIADVPVFYRSAGPLPAGSAQPLYLHEAITSSEDWLPFLERTGGLAPDLIGFGRSGKGGHLDYTPEALTSFLVELLAALEVERVTLIGHGWGGALALLLALRDPARVQRIALIGAVPLLPGFSWHGPARTWRRPLIGELVMGATSRRQLIRQLRKGSVRPEAWGEQRCRAVWEEFDQGTQRALLRLHRTAGEARLQELGEPLNDLTMPALVIWGERDPWFPPAFADAYAAALPDAHAERIEAAGHWPWLDRPEVIERIATFVSGT